MEISKVNDLMYISPGRNGGIITFKPEERSRRPSGLNFEVGLAVLGRNKTF